MYQETDDGQMVPIKGDISDDVFLAIDRAEDDAIAKALAGTDYTEHYMYSYEVNTKDGKKLIAGISVDGARLAAQLMGNIEVMQDIRVEEKDDYFYGIVRARDILRNVILLGVARQCKFMVDRGNKPVKGRLNEMAFVCAISKAQRNAILNVLSPEAKVKAVNMFAEQKKIRRLPPVPQTGAPTASGATAQESEVAAPTATSPAKVAIPNYTPVIQYAKELQFGQEDMMKVLNVETMNSGEWYSKGVTVEGAKEALKKRKDDLQKSVQDLLTQMGPTQLAQPEVATGEAKPAETKPDDEKTVEELFTGQEATQAVTPEPSAAETLDIQPESTAEEAKEETTDEPSDISF